MVNEPERKKALTAESTGNYAKEGKKSWGFLLLRNLIPSVEGGGGGGGGIKRVVSIKGLNKISVGERTNKFTGGRKLKKKKTKTAVSNKKKKKKERFHRQGIRRTRWPRGAAKTLTRKKGTRGEGAKETTRGKEKKKTVLHRQKQKAPGVAQIGEKVRTETKRD